MSSKKGKSKKGGEKKEKCDGCNKVVEGNMMIECERCELWFCKPCSRLQESFEHCASHPVVIHWYCVACNTSAVKAVKTDNVVENKCKEYIDALRLEMRAEMKTHIDSIEGKLKKTADALRAEDKNLKDSIDRLRTEIDEKLTNVASETAASSHREIQERMARSNNIMIFKVEESQSEDAEVRKTADLNHTKAICNQLGCNPVPEIKQVIRIGKKTQGKVRPIKAVMDSSESVIKMLRSSNRLKDSIYKDVVLKNDMTPMEREETKKLLQERHQKREESKRTGEEVNWIIRGGKVIRGKQLTVQQPPPQGEPAAATGPPDPQGGLQTRAVGPPEPPPAAEMEDT